MQDVVWLEIEPKQGAYILSGDIVGVQCDGVKFFL